jgi:COP9 signalosome complex subunit 7
LYKKTRSSTTATLLQTLDAKLVSLAEHNAAKAREEAEHQDALNVVLKDVADRLREKQNATKRAAAAAARKDGRDADGMDVDEPGGTDARSKGSRKYVVVFLPSLWVCLLDADDS